MAYTNVWDDSVPLDTQAAAQGAADFRQLKLDVMQRIASFGAGLLANRPTPETTSGVANWAGVMYWTTDTSQTFMWNGAAWVDITASGSSSAAQALATTGVAVNVSLSAPPVAGDILIATDATHATWQPNPAAQLGAVADVGFYSFVAPTTNHSASTVGIPVGVLAIGSIITFDTHAAVAGASSDTAQPELAISSTSTPLGSLSPTGNSQTTGHFIVVITSNTTFTYFENVYSTDTGVPVANVFAGTCLDITASAFVIALSLTAGAGPNSGTYEFDFLSAVVN